jgi:polyisoprenyl-phosphate glycosyltransferase
MIQRSLDNLKLYALVPAYNEADLIEDFIKTLDEKLSEFAADRTIIVVDDGSQDKTAEIVRRLSTEYPIHFISFSRNFGKEAAITAGINAANDADALVIIDADFQHPLEVVNQFIEKWLEGYDNIYGIRTRRDQGFLKGFLSSSFYKINKRIMRIDLPANAGDFRLVDRQVIQAINCLPEANRFMKGLYAWVGFKGCPVNYTVAERAGEGTSKWGYSKLFELAITGITAFSDIPLRFVSMLGFFVSFISILYGTFIIVEKLVFGIPLQGWATIAASIMFFGGIQLISIGVLGEYISRIFNEVKQRPTYIVDRRTSIDKKEKDTKK